MEHEIDNKASGKASIGLAGLGMAALIGLFSLTKSDFGCNTLQHSNSMKQTEKAATVKPAQKVQPN